MEQKPVQVAFFGPSEQVEWVELVVGPQSVLFGKTVWCTIGPQHSANGMILRK